MAKKPLIYIEHIIESIEKIISYTQGFSKEDFLKTPVVQDAVIRNFEIIGEASKHVNAEFREKYPKIEWKKMAGMRDKLIHDYIGVDLWAVWAVVEEILPALNHQLKTILNQ